MKEISENYKKVLENLDSLSDGEDKKLQISRTSYTSKAPKDLLHSVLTSRSNKVHIPMPSQSQKNKGKKRAIFSSKSPSADLSAIFLKLTHQFEQKENVNFE